MKVYIGPRAASGSGGMYRVLNGLYDHLPVEIVDHPNKADVVHAQINLYAEVDPNIPLVVSSHGLMWEHHKWGRIADKMNLECLSAYRVADAVTAPSKFVARAIARYTLAAPRVAHHGIDPKEWLPKKDHSNYVLWNKARSDAGSNPITMNRLAKFVPDIMFYSTFGQEDTNVVIFGLITPEDMKEVVADAGVYLASSQESGGPCFGVLEAMSCAVPVLSWDWGGTSEVIKHKETGYLARLGDYDDLATGLRYCLEHRERLGANARQDVIDNYQWGTVIHDYVKAYQDAIDNVKAPKKVSVIVPCYKLEKFLPACIDSVLNQTYRNFELIIVDDNSPGNTEEIVAGYNDPRIVLIKNNPNKHVSDSRNTAIHNSVGQYVLPLDADDRLYPDALENMVKALDKDRGIAVVAGKLTIHHEHNLKLFTEGGWPNGVEPELQLKGHNRLPYASMYRRDLWKRIGGYRRRIRNGIEDADFWTRVFSFGYRAELLDNYTLMYTQREQSLGKSGGGTTYLHWFPWTYENSPAVVTSIPSFDPPKVSVIIPVGPGHDRFIQSCLDSLIAQTEQDWEAIFINDTGKRWFEEGTPKSFYLNGTSMAVMLDSDQNKGVAHARNRGIRAAKADRLVFLDVDDIAQPTMLEALIAAHAHAGGWIYGDWFMNDGTTLTRSNADDWDVARFHSQSLAPITGLYERGHALLVGGFTEDAPGWEDWDFQLKLVSNGICGTRLEYPLITYNMHYGARREENFANKTKLLQYIYKKFPKDKVMACSKCGGKRTVTVQTGATATVSPEAQVELQYLGLDAGTRSFTNVPSRSKYRVNNSKTFFAIESDAEYFLQKRDQHGKPLFKLVSKAEPVVVGEQAPLQSQDIPEAPVSIETLALDDKTIGILKARGISTVTELRMMPDSEILGIKGVGPQRLEQIKEALWK